MLDDDELDGCLSDVENIDEEMTQDADVDGIVLFADIDPKDQDAIERRKVEWGEVFKDGV
jgi:hypothetical protein